MATELESGRILELAVGAGQHEPCGALTTELHAGGIFEVTFRAAHRLDRFLDPAVDVVETAGHE